MVADVTIYCHGDNIISKSWFPCQRLVTIYIPVKNKIALAETVRVVKFSQLLVIYFVMMQEFNRILYALITSAGPQEACLKREGLQLLHRDLTDVNV